MSIPHGGQKVPTEAADRCALTEENIFQESDAFTPQIYGMADAVLGQVTQDVARAIVDLNRSQKEVPPLAEDGAIKSITSNGEPVWQVGSMPDKALMEVLLEQHYFPYHRRLEAMLAEHSSQVRLLIDCHTMAPVGPSKAKDAEKRRPLICLSNLGDEIGVAYRRKRTSLPSQLILELGSIMADVFAEDIATLSHASPVLINNPFKGGHITQHYSSLGYRVLQVELSKDLYLHPRWFDSEARTVDEERIRELNGKLRSSFTELAAFIG
jgi:N-formylglutamate amidohydrolase